MLEKTLDLGRGIFSALLEDPMYAKTFLSTHMANLLETQSKIIERHRQTIQKGD